MSAAQLSMLPRPARKPKSRAMFTNTYDKQNLQAAEIILTNIEKYGGEGAGLVLWARAFLRRIREEKAVGRA
jgi:hypothetical protein